MWARNRKREDRITIFVVRTIDDFIVERYTTSVEDMIYIPLSEAERACKRLGNGHYRATGNQEIAIKYKLDFIQSQSP